MYRENIIWTQIYTKWNPLQSTSNTNLNWGPRNYTVQFYENPYLWNVTENWILMELSNTNKEKISLNKTDLSYGNSFR